MKDILNSLSFYSSWRHLGIVTSQTIEARVDPRNINRVKLARSYFATTLEDIQKAKVKELRDILKCNSKRAGGTKKEIEVTEKINYRLLSITKVHKNR